MYISIFLNARRTIMKIIVCMKQVPASSKVEIDEETGTLKRLGSDTKANPYDLYALEAALKIREKHGGTVTALTMGPKQAEEMMKDAYMCGADDAVVLSDLKFAGSDVLATSYTLSQGILLIGGADLIICGRQTTDGDTAQIGPAIAEHLNMPHAAWVSEILEIKEKSIVVKQDLASVSQISEMPFPCLITVDKDINVPRLPSYILKKETADKTVRFYAFDDLPDNDLSRYGLVGSPTNVEKMFAPPVNEKKIFIEGSDKEKTEKIFEILSAGKFI
jgi:electron transfer flavoprotein beta subunit